MATLQQEFPYLFVILVNNVLRQYFHFFNQFIQIAIDRIFVSKFFKGRFLKYLIIYLTLNILRFSEYLLYSREFNSFIFFFTPQIMSFAIPVFVEKKLLLVRTFKKYRKKISASGDFFSNFFLTLQIFFSFQRIYMSFIFF